MRCRVKAYAYGLEYIADPVQLAEKSDFLFVALAALAKTRHIVSRDVIAALGPDGMLINVSRASNIDETALLDTLENGALGSAALDVFDNEPNINRRFLALGNVLLKLHQVSGTVETRKAMRRLCVIISMRIMCILRSCRYRLPFYDHARDGV